MFELNDGPRIRDQKFNVCDRCYTRSDFLDRKKIARLLKERKKSWGHTAVFVVGGEAIGEN